MERYEWDNEFANIIMKKIGISRELAMQIADNADDSYVDGDSPSDAVDTELSYWDN